MESSELEIINRILMVVKQIDSDMRYVEERLKRIESKVHILGETSGVDFRQRQE